MTQNSVVTVCKQGSLLAISDQYEKACRLLEDALSYTRVSMVYERGTQRMVSTPYDCYAYKQDKQGLLPRRLICAAGYLHRITRVLKHHGLQVQLRDFTKPPAPETFQPHWDRLAGVEWKWMQQRCIQRLVTEPYMQLKCPPGYGKSFLLYCLAKVLPKAKIVVSTQSVDVLEQLHAELASRLPDVGLVTGASKRFGRRINCVSGKSLHRVVEPPDLLIVDEVHECGTDDYMEKFASAAFRFARHIGLSANAGQRPDGAWFELEGFFGPVLIDLSYQDCVKHGAVVPIEVHWRDVVMDKDPASGLTNRVEKLRSGIWCNRFRNNLIARDARSFGDRQVLISVDVIEHALQLKRELPHYTLCYSEDGLSESERQRAIKNKLLPEDEPVMTRERRRQLKSSFEHGTLKHVIATTVWKRGVDFKSLEVLIRADAGASLISDTQIPGRTSRLSQATSKTSSIVVDYLDQFGSFFRERANVRRRNYKEHGWTQCLPGNGSNPRQRSLL